LGFLLHELAFAHSSGWPLWQRLKNLDHSGQATSDEEALPRRASHVAFATSLC
jgi:hypothetical protein